MTLERVTYPLIHIQSFSIGPIGTNCYVIYNDSGEAFVVDVGYECAPLLDAVRDLSVSHILLTHGHYDHIGGVAQLKDATGAKVCIHHLEKDWLTDPSLNLSQQSAAFLPWTVEGPAPDELLRDGQKLSLLGETIEVRHTPGHSPGHVSFIMGGVVFGGDALFHGSIGRTDLPYGSHDQLMESIRTQLLTLPGSTTVLPGHGPATTVTQEAETNPFLLDLN